MDLRALMSRLSKLPRAKRLGVIGLFYVLFVGVFWVLFWSPASVELADLKEQTSQLESNRQRVRIRAGDREKFEEELNRLTNRLSTALRELPNEREIADLLKRISLVGKRVGLEVRKFQPLPENVEEYYAEVPAALEVAGSYHEIAMFFDRLSKLGRIVSVRNVHIADPEEVSGRVELTVTGQVVTYRFLTTEEAEANQQTQRGSGRRGRRGKSKGKAGGGH